MQTIDTTTVNIEIAELERVIVDDNQRLERIVLNGEAEREEARVAIAELRQQIKAAITNGDDGRADDLMREWARADDGLRDCSYRWTGRELRTRNDIDRAQDNIRRAQGLLTLQQHLGGAPVTYEDIFAAFDHAIDNGLTLWLDVDDYGPIELNGQELPEFRSEIYPGEGIRILGFLPAKS